MVLTLQSLRISRSMQGVRTMKTKATKLIPLGKASRVTAATFEGNVPERETMVLYNYI